MRTPLLGFCLIVLLGCGTDSAPPEADTGYGPGHARAALISDKTGVAPGGSITLGITFDIEPNWHLYWNGLNDTGYPIQVHTEFPEGYVTGELEWPAPTRHVSTGDILDHIYSGQVTLLLPVTVPADTDPGTMVTFSCRVEWLSCREVCIPGEDRVSLTLPILDNDGSEGGIEYRPETVKGAHEKTLARMAKTRARLPLPLEEAAGVAWKWENSALVLDVMEAEHLTFYPHLDSAPLESLLRDGVAEGGRLTLALSEEAQSDQAVSGVLEIAPGSSAPSLFYTIQIPLNNSK